MKMHPERSLIMDVYFHETQETIDILRRVVYKLDEKHGWINAEELWDGVQWCVLYSFYNIWMLTLLLHLGAQ